MAIASAEVIVPSQVASTVLSAGAANEQVWLQASAASPVVYIGPSGVTPQTGLPIPSGELMGPINLGNNALHGVVGEGQSSVGVRVLRISP
jgi:hypothetical protein